MEGHYLSTNGEICFIIWLFFLVLRFVLLCPFVHVLINDSFFIYIYFLPRYSRMSVIDLLLQLTCQNVSKIIIFFLNVQFISYFIYYLYVLNSWETENLFFNFDIFCGCPASYLFQVIFFGNRNTCLLFSRITLCVINKSCLWCNLRNICILLSLLL